MTHMLGGKVVPSTHREYGRALVNRQRLTGSEDTAMPAAAGR